MITCIPLCCQSQAFAFTRLGFVRLFDAEYGDRGVRRLRELLLVPKCEINPDPLVTSPCSGHVVIKTQENMG